MIQEPAPQTIAEFFARTVVSRSNEPALVFVRSGELQWLTWQEVADATDSLATELQAAGIAPGDRVAHVSENRHEWIITDLALHLAGAVHVPIHVTLSGSQIAEQVCDSGAKLVFVSTKALLQKFAEQIPRDLNIQLYDDSAHQPPALPGVSNRQHALRDEPPAEPGAATIFGSLMLSSSSSPTDLATILYTSGTTGRPRGVML